MIKVSVIVPVYKVPLKYLRACLDSLAAQTLQECEFIVVSDGAPEAECAICAEYAGKDSRLKFFRREHAGVSATRNYGIEQAQGEYISFVDADDIIKKETLETLYFHASQWDSDVISTNYGTTNKSHVFIPFNKKNISNFNRTNLDIVFKEFINEKNNSLPRGPCGKLYKRNFLYQNNIRFLEYIEIGEDIIFNFNVFSKAKILSYLPNELYQYRNNAFSTTRKYETKAFKKYLTPLVILNDLVGNKYSVELANETLQSFYGCLMKIYQANLGKDLLLEELHFLQKETQSKTFIKLIQASNIHFNDIQRNIEIFLMKKGFSIFFHLRILKFKIFHHYFSRFQ